MLREQRAHFSFSTLPVAKLWPLTTVPHCMVKSQPFHDWEATEGPVLQILSLFGVPWCIAAGPGMQKCSLLVPKCRYVTFSLP